MGAPFGSDDTQLGVGAIPGGVASGAPGQPTAPLGGRLPAEALPIGTLIGEYQVERVLGEGGMGSVYGARHPVIGKRVAIKVLKMDLSKDPALVRRFVDEARAVNKIGHPNIIDIFSFGQLPDGRQYFVMEYLEGETLGERLAQGAMPADEARRLLLQVCEALEAAHREKVVHRDLKPENIWIARPRHGEPYVKVLDFGIAKLLESDTVNVTQTGVALGTPLYMSPEQCLGQGVDHRTDIYAMGVLLYQVYAGRVPFDGRSFAEVLAQQLTATPPPPSQWKSLSPAVDAVILGCLEKDPAKRPQTAAELGLALRSALVDASGQTALLSAVSESEQGQATRQGFGPAVPVPGTASRPRTALVAIVVIGVVLGLGAAVLLLRGDNKSVPPAVVVPAVVRPVVVVPVVVPPVVAPVPSPVAVPPVAAPPVEKSHRGTTRSGPAPAAEPAPAAKKPGKSRVDDKGLDTDNPFK